MTRFLALSSISVLRLLFIIFVSLLGWSYMQLDVNSAYLYAPLRQTIYMKQPVGFVKDNERDKVCLIRKALYGLHQSAREWNNEFEETVCKLDFVKLKSCNSVYVYKNCKAILLIYVDDIVIFSKSQICIKEIVSLLKVKFEIKILGKTKKLLGIQFDHVGNDLYIHQHQYIEKLCKLYDKYNLKLSTLPITKNVKLTKSDCPVKEFDRLKMQNFPYRNLLGSLAFIASRTRPDIAFTVNYLSQFQENPGYKHWEALLRLLGYLKYTLHYKLTLSNVFSLHLTGYADADYAGNIDDRKSISGLILLIGKAPISWITRKQRSISLSTLEAEYISLGELAKELIWMKRILEDPILSLKLEGCTVFCDNAGAIEFSKSNVERSRSKHIDVRFHFIRNLVADEVFSLKHVISKNNIADIFTKAPTRIQHQFCTQFFKMD